MIGSQVLHYKIIEKLGEGGMGVVYRAEDTRLHRDVALKFLPDEALEREEDRARFIAEARAAAALDHPNICTIHDISEADGHYFIAMAFVDGRDIKEAIDSDGPMPVLDAVRLGAQVAEGLSAAHEKGIVHRDIKSANVMITSRGRAKIMDFGLAQRPLDDRAPGEVTTGGTIAYASPEQVSGEPVDHRGDIWSFGAMLYEMVTGVLPFGGDYESAIIYSILNETPAAPSSVREGIPEALDGIIARALAKKPEDRYQSIDEMRADLVQLRNAIDPNISRAHVAGASDVSVGKPWQRVAAAVGGWLLISWVAAKIAGLIVGNQQLSPHLVTMTAVGMIAFLPAVALVAYFTGRRGSNRWGKPEMVGVPLNAVLAGALIAIAFSGKDLGAAMQKVEVTNEEGEKIERVIPKGAFRKNFALYAFENTSGDAALDWLECAMPTLLESDLYQDAFITARSALDPSSWERLQQAGFKSWKDAPLALKRKIAGELHESQFVTASVDKEGADYVFNVRVHDTDSGKALAQHEYRGSDIFALADEIAVDLKHAVGVPAWHLDGAPDVPVADMMTESEGALREYTGALKAMIFDQDWDAARNHLDAAVEADSTMAYAHFQRFLAYRLTNDYEGAQLALQDALRHAYKVPERFRFIIKGNYYFLKQEPDKALALFEMMAELYPDDIQSFQALAQIHTMRNEIDEAIVAYERVIELDPYQYDHFHEIAGLAIRKGDYDKALTYTQRYADLNPEDPTSFEELAELNQDMGDFKAARKNIEKALLLDPERVTLLIGAGNIASALGEFDDAVKKYEDAFQLARSSTDSMRVMIALENYYEMRGEYNKAIELMNQRVTMSPTPLGRYSQRLDGVERYVYAGRVDEAFAIMEEVKRAFDSPPMSYAVPYGYVQVYMIQEKPDELEKAIAGFEQYIEAFRLEMLRPIADLARARVLELRRDYEGAVAIIESTIAKNPGHPAAYRSLGRCFREMGRLDEAAAELEHSIKLAPSSGESNYELALILHARGEQKKAREHLDRALAVWENADPAYQAAVRARATAAEWDAAASM